MKKSTAFVLFPLLFSLFVPGLCFGVDSVKTAATIGPGLWMGSASLKAVRSTGIGDAGTAGTATDTLQLTLSLRLIDQGQGLLEIPEQGLFGYPLSKVDWTAKRLSFQLDAFGPGQEMNFVGVLGIPEGTQDSPEIAGTVSSKDWRGSFKLSFQTTTRTPGEFLFAVQLQDGKLPGTLVVPKGAFNANEVSDSEFTATTEIFPVPLVILLSGAGPTDRNGNNFNVPGKTDTLLQLSQKLAAKGVATYRFDKRGSGEAFWLEKSDQVTSLAIHARDAAEVIRHFCTDGRFSRVLVAGMNEGAWVGAMALNQLNAEGVFADGLIVLDASGEDPEDQLKDSLKNLSPEIQAEAARIEAAIEKGEPFGQPSAQLAAFFAPSRTEWVAAWLACHPATEIAAVNAPVFFVRGDEDLQVSKASFEKLLDARPNSVAYAIPSMNYVLKLVKSNEENYDAFVNPSYEVPQRLVDLIEALAKVKRLPASIPVYQRDSPQDLQVPQESHEE